MWTVINNCILCISCEKVAHWSRKFAQENRAKFIEALHLFLNDGPNSVPTIEKPLETEDGNLVRFNVKAFESLKLFTFFVCLL